MTFTALYLRSATGYVGFIEELPGINSYGRSLDEARTMLVRLAEVAFDAERRASAELLRGREVLREAFVLRAAD
ncbi:MAG TPA: type II toxin-antitoxin system HicB family antitoxin [Burkholderiales bacterium]|jgi:predicted RNase H-like HicB family nuclease|nr:type II toxin-antitoxin system HicB family antitoxin [Burkholderiales bacterium]